MANEVQSFQVYPFSYNKKDLYKALLPNPQSANTAKQITQIPGSSDRWTLNLEGTC